MPVVTKWYQVDIDTGSAWLALPANHANVGEAKAQALRISDALDGIATRITYVTHTDDNGRINIKSEVIEE
jgi:hypothetical protein